MTLVITCIPSPYQVELFDSLARHLPGFRAAYVSRRDPARSWRHATLQHDAFFLDEVADARRRLLVEMDTAGLVVFADYSTVAVRDAMRARAGAQKPWCFWGERPGSRRLGPLGRIWRRVRLDTLHRSRQAPIWGIGQWAVDEYRGEFGDGRLYLNFPYFSDLTRFGAVAPQRSAASSLRVLYSGALIKRKGVDLLAAAFRRLVQTHGNVTLSVVGSGPLRPLMADLLGPATSNVVFHDFVPWSDLPRFYAGADVLCAPSRYDGWGLIVPEAMAAGMPVIATDRMGAALDLIEPGSTGWLTRAESEPQLYEALKAAAELAPSRWAEMGRAAQTRAMQQDVPAGVQRFHEAQEATLGAWRAGPAASPPRR